MVLSIVVFVGSLVSLKVTLRESPFWKHFLLLLCLFVGLIVGGRVFNTLFISPPLHSQDSGFAGMTFYGGALVALVVFVVLAKWMYPPSSHRRLFDVAAVLSAFACGILRLGCLAGGCCWGRVTGFWGAIRYTDHRSAMPYLGVPVHPVQLYDSLGNLLLGVGLMYLYRKKMFSGRLAYGFFGGYACLRFLSEFFRGDSFRGDDVLLGLSTSQTISCGIIIVFLGWLLVFQRRFT